MFALKSAAPGTWMPDEAALGGPTPLAPVSLEQTLDTWKLGIMKPG